MNGRLGTSARGALFAGSTVALVGVALTAGGIGPWTSRPLTDREPDSRPIASESIAAPPRTRAAAGPEVEAPPALKLGLQLLLVAVIAFALTLLVRWLYRKVTDLTSARDELLAGDRELPPMVGLESAPRIRNRESGRDFDPRAAADAIISCWLWVESAAAATGSVRRKADTPTEFLHQFVSRQRSAGSASAARTREAAEVLLPLYQRARFDRVALTQDAAVRARAAAETLCGVRRAGSVPPAEQEEQVR